VLRDSSQIAASRGLQQRRGRLSRESQEAFPDGCSEDSKQHRKRQGKQTP